MATQTDSGGRGGTDKPGTSSWAGIVGGGKNDTSGEASKQPVEDKPVNDACVEVAAGVGGEAAALPAEPAGDDLLDPEELSQFTEIRNKKDRARKKEGSYRGGGRKDKRGGGGRREYVEWEPRYDRGEGASRGRGGKRPGRELGPKVLNGPEGEEEGVEEGQAVTEGEEEKVHYVPAPAPMVNIWEKRRSVPAPAMPPLAQAKAPAAHAKAPAAHAKAPPAHAKAPAAHAKAPAAHARPLSPMPRPLPRLQTP